MLNTEAIGKVVKVHPKYPLRPCLNMIRDSHGRAIKDGQPIDLAEEPLLFIQDSISDEEFGNIAADQNIF